MIKHRYIQPFSKEVAWQEVWSSMEVPTMFLHLLHFYVVVILARIQTFSNLSQFDIDVQFTTSYFTLLQNLEDFMFIVSVNFYKTHFWIQLSRESSLFHTCQPEWQAGSYSMAHLQMKHVSRYILLLSILNIGNTDVTNTSFGKYVYQLYFF